MKRSIRIISAILSAMLVASAFVGCATPDQSTDTTAGTASGNATGPADTIPETDPVQDAIDALREEVDWKGEEFGILYVNDIGGYTEEVEAKEKADDTTSSAVINDAVFNPALYNEVQESQKKQKKIATRWKILYNGK